MRFTNGESMLKRESHIQPPSVCFGNSSIRRSQYALRRGLVVAAPLQLQLLAPIWDFACFFVVTAAAATGDKLARLNRAAASLALHAHCDAVVDLAHCVTESEGSLVKALTRLSKAATAAGALTLAHQAAAAARTEAEAAAAGSAREPNDAKLLDEAASVLRELETKLAPLARCRITTWAAATGVSPDAAAAGGAGSASSSAKATEDDSIAAVVDALCTADAVGIRRAPIIASPAEAEAAAAALLAALADAPHSRRLSFALANALVDARRPEAAAAALKALQQAAAASDDGLLGSPPATVTVCHGGVDGAAAAVGASAAPELAVGSVAAHLPVATLLAHAYAATGDIAAALAALKAAAADDPDCRSPEAAAVLGLRRELTRLSALKGAANEVFKAGRHADALKQYSELGEAFDAALGYTPSFVHANAAAAHLGMGSADAALAACNAAITALPYSARAWSRRAACLTERRPADPDGAAEALAVAQFLTKATAGTADDAALAAQLFKARAQAGIDPDADDGHGGDGEGAILAHPSNDREADALLKPALSSHGAVLQPIFHAASSGSGAAAGSNGRRLVIVDAFATWCGPCKAIAPAFAKLAASHAIPRFVKLDGDKCRATAGRLGVRAFPTFVVLLDGEEIDNMEGADPRRLLEMVANAVTAWRRRAQPLPRASAVVAAPVGKAVLTAGVETSAEVAAVLARALASGRIMMTSSA